MHLLSSCPLALLRPGSVSVAARPRPHLLYCRRDGVELAYKLAAAPLYKTRAPPIFSTHDVRRVQQQLFLYTIRLRD